MNDIRVSGQIPAARPRRNSTKGLCRTSQHSVRQVIRIALQEELWQ